MYGDDDSDPLSSALGGNYGSSAGFRQNAATSAANRERVTAAASRAREASKDWWVSLAPPSKEERELQRKQEKFEAGVQNGTIIGVSNLRVRKRVLTRKMYLQAPGNNDAPPVAGNGKANAHDADAPTRDVATKPLPISDGYLERRIKVAQLVTSLRHPNVLAHFGVVRGEQQKASQGLPSLELVMEWCVGGSLAGHMSEKAPPKSRRLRWCVETAWAAAAMHSVGLAHRDYKPSNLLLITAPPNPRTLQDTAAPNAEERAKLAAAAEPAVAALEKRDPPAPDGKSAWWTARMVVSDFDVAVEPGKKTNKCTTPRTGTFKYMAPEVFQMEDSVSHALFGSGASSDDSDAGGYDAYAIDVFSFGVVMWELLEWKSAYQDRYMMAEDIAHGVVRSASFRPSQKQEIGGLSDLPSRMSSLLRPYLGFLLPPEPEPVPKSLLELCEKCWHANPEKRPTMSAVLTELVKLVQEDEDVIAWSSRSFTTKS